MCEECRRLSDDGFANDEECDREYNTKNSIEETTVQHKSVERNSCTRMFQIQNCTNHPHIQTHSQLVQSSGSEMQQTRYLHVLNVRASFTLALQLCSSILQQNRKGCFIQDGIIDYPFYKDY